MASDCSLRPAVRELETAARKSSLPNTAPDVAHHARNFVVRVGRRLKTSPEASHFIEGWSWNVAKPQVLLANDPTIDGDEQ